MSELRISSETDGRAPLATFTRHADIARELAQVGVRFDQWEAAKPVHLQGLLPSIRFRFRPAQIRQDLLRAGEVRTRLQQSRDLIGSV